ncbi:hypothetical protein [Streptacidiphilus rugosus]|uniref:hypothetical protein n=1 Tax=Streptacidiphilus rugosus TaxID=405783 RepID=UPI0005642CEA|nr:hypothetical protein [Streptacidiphilus rugosus]
MTKRPQALRPTLRLAGAGAAVACLATACSADARSAADWRAAHPELPSTLVRGVSWPGAHPERIEARGSGFRTVLKFGDDDDADQGAIVWVAPAATDPCRVMPTFVTDGATPADPRLLGSTTDTAVSCTPAGRDAWTLHATGSDRSGYAVRRDGVLLVLTTTDDWTDPDYPSIARTLHPLDDRELSALL